MFPFLGGRSQLTREQRVVIDKLGVGPDSFLEEMICRHDFLSEESINSALVEAVTRCQAMKWRRRRQPAMGGGVSHLQSPSQCVCAPIPLPPTSQLLDAGPGGEAPGGEDDAAPGGGPDAKEPEEGAAPHAEAGLGKENPPPKRVRYSKQEPEREGEARALDSALDPRQALLKRMGLIWRRCYDMRKSGYKNYLPGGL